MKKGDLCLCKFGHRLWNLEAGEKELVAIDMRPELVGKKCILQHPNSDCTGWSVKFIDTGQSISWIPNKDLELIIEEE